MPTEEALIITPSQTVGPFYAYCLTPEEYSLPVLIDARAVTVRTAGERITLRGYVYDGDGKVAPDALIELWQPDGEGCFAGQEPAPSDPDFKGFARTNCEPLGCFEFQTVKPGAVMGANGALQAPHIALSIFGKGLNRRLYTRVYFDDEAANENDEVLSLVPSELRPALVARCVESGIYVLDIHLQGEKESVFFEV
jgi:protocatechuate 3,4-dioxygenase alpha subunit